MRKFLFFFITITLVNNKVLSLDLTITQGSIKPTPIAISNFFSSTDSTFRIGKNISMVISDNLEPVSYTHLTLPTKA